MKRALRITAIALASLIGLTILVVGGYVLYVVLQYDRIEDHLALPIEGAGAEIGGRTEFTVLTYNVGFGAYAHDFSFFMDSGEMKTGEKVSGTGSKAKDRETVLANTNGAIGVAREQNADFYLFQEVDEKSDRARGVDQRAAFTEAFPDYASTFAVNFRSAYLFYPLGDPHGKTLAGLLTLSRFAPASAERRSYPVSGAFPDKFFDLDRAFSVHRYPAGEGKELVLVNSHMSAYDEGGLIRKKQLELLNAVLAEEREKGNYVVVGGDFNHDIAASGDLFETRQKKPEWVYELSDEDLAEGYRFAASRNAPTCRSTDMPYEKGVNYTVVLDGFIVSDNIEVVGEVRTVDTDFAYSDHNPSKMTFRLLP